MRRNKRISRIWTWNSIKPQPAMLLTQKKLLIVLLLTSVFWVSLDLLFLLHRQTPIIDLDILVVNPESKRKIGFATFTPPKRHPVSVLAIPPEASLKRNKHLETTKLGNLSMEFYSELIIPDLGEDGKPAILPTELKTLSVSLFNNHSFDSVLSARISLNRQLPNARGEKCTKKESIYPKELPTTSIVICFHNEAITALLRTVHSVINNTPEKLLANIVLVDDASTTEILFDGVLSKYIAKLNTVLHKETISLTRNEKREGLVRSRLKGVEMTTGDVLTFLDSHCEVTKGWVEPLLDRIRSNKRNVVCPVIEVIDAVDFSYKKAEIHQITQVGGFTWDLFFNWKEITEEVKKSIKDGTEPLKSPTMAGGLFSINKSYFYEVGSYDEEMDIWGGENLEMSFRIWMCGGNLEIIPCSRVGHIFRKENSPYTFPDGVSKTLAKNFNRLAEVWMDDYKELYYRRKPAEDRKVDFGNITSRLALRERMQCKSFQWYIENIIPDMIGADPNPPAYGEVRNNASNKCLDSLGSKGNKGKVKMYPCHGMEGNQLFILSKRGEIVFNDEGCLDYSSGNDLNRVEIWNCHGLGGNQEWKHQRHNGLIEHMISGKCLVPDENDFLTVDECNQSNKGHIWLFSNYDKKLW